MPNAIHISASGAGLCHSHVQQQVEVGALHPLQCKALRTSLRLAPLGLRRFGGMCEAMQRSMHATDETHKRNK